MECIEQIAAVCAAVGKPVNVLARPDLPLREIADAGAQRISVGGQLTWVAAGAMAAAAQRIRDLGDLSALSPAVPAKEIASWLAQGAG